MYGMSNSTFTVIRPKKLKHYDHRLHGADRRSSSMSETLIKHILLTRVSVLTQHSQRR